MKATIGIILGTIAASLAGCNHEVFVPQIEVAPYSAYLPWTGGNTELTANQSLPEIQVVAFRRSNGHAASITEETTRHRLTDDYPTATISNELCNIKLTKTGSRSLSIQADYNYFTDTIFFNIDLIGEFETAKRGVAMMPSPGFDHGDIEYTLSSWLSEDIAAFKTIKKLTNMSDVSTDLTVMKAGEVIMTSTAEFVPWNKLVSDNIFGNKQFKVRGVKCDASTWWMPALATESVLYTTAEQELPGPLICNEDVVVTVPPRSTISSTISITGEIYGVSYTLPAINPIDGSKISIDGLYKMHIPRKYEIRTEIKDL